jgi:hypothetical protein
VAAVAEAGETGTKTRSVAGINRDVRALADAAGDQLDGAKSIHGMGDAVNTLTESLLLSVGRFRFAAHAAAQQLVGTLLPALVDCRDHRAQLEHTIEQWLAAHPHFELAYLTNAEGRQIVDNLRRRDERIVRDPSGFNRDWSSRPWYRAAVAAGEVHATDLYRSHATGDFCFTVAAPFYDSARQFAGVFAADVNFQRLVRRD